MFPFIMVREVSSFPDIRTVLLAVYVLLEDLRQPSVYLVTL